MDSPCIDSASARPSGAVKRIRVSMACMSGTVYYFQANYPDALDNYRTVFYPALIFKKASRTCENRL